MSDTNDLLLDRVAKAIYEARPYCTPDFASPRPMAWDVLWENDGGLLEEFHDRARAAITVITAWNRRPSEDEREATARLLAEQRGVFWIQLTGPAKAQMRRDADAILARFRTPAPETTCFECGHDLLGPVCPACNPPTAQEWPPPEGWVLLPKEPTREMWAAMGNAVVKLTARFHGAIPAHDAVSSVVYQAACAVAPAPPTASTQEG